MRKLTRNLFFASCLASILSAGGVFSSAIAQEKLPVASIAVVDVTHVLNKSESWVNAEKAMKGRISDVQVEINKKRDALNERAEELKRQQTILAPDVFQQKAKEIQIEQRQLQREAQVSNAKVNDILNQVRGRLRGVIVKIAASVASEKKLNIGFDRANVVFFNDGMDITDEVLKRFNESKTKVEITVDKKQ